MTAALREKLILKIDARRARRFKFLYGVVEIDRVAEARVAVGHDGDADGVADVARKLDHLRLGQDADVRLSQIAAREAVAGHLNGLHAALLGDLRADAVVDAGHDQNIFCLNVLL